MRTKKLCSRGTGTPSARQQRSHHEEPAALSESKPISITLDAAMNSSKRRHSTQFGSTRIPYTADPHADYCTRERPSHFIFPEFLRVSRVRSSRRFALRVELLLDHRLCWLSGGYGVCVPMHHLPLTIFGSKDPRDPHVDRGNVLPCVHLGLYPLYPHNVGKLRSYWLRDHIEASDLAISDSRCCMLYGPSNLLPSACGWARGLARVTSSRWENSFFTASGSPFTNSSSPS